MPRNLNDLPLNDDPQDTDWLLGASGISPAVFQKIPVGLVKAPSGGGGGSIFVPVNAPTTLTEGGLFFTDTLASNLLVTFDNPPVGSYIRWLNYSSKSVIFDGFTTVDGGISIPTNQGIQIPPSGAVEGFVNQSGNFKKLSGSYSTSWLPGFEPEIPFFENVVLFLKGDGANNSTNIFDSSFAPKTVSVVGDAKISTTQSKYGGSSLLFDGNGDYLSIASESSLNRNNQDFTEEAWVYLTGYANNNSGYYNCTIAGKDSPSSREYSFLISGTASSFNQLIWGGFVGGANYFLSANFAFALNTWYHVAACRKNNVLRLFVNGTKVAEQAFAYNINSTSISQKVGALIYDTTSYPYYFKGYVDSYRLTIGFGAYTSNFNPETDSFLV